MNPALQTETVGGDPRIFRVNRDSQSVGKGVLRVGATSLLERLLGLEELGVMYARIFEPGKAGSQEFLQRLLVDLALTSSVGDADLARVPRLGPLLVVANHPFGAPEGLLLMQIFRRVRPDLKLMANSILERVPELHELIIFVDPYGGETSVSQNRSAMRRAMQLVHAGGALGVFPSGDVAHFEPSKAKVLEQKWSGAVARIARRTGATVLPVHFEGRNSLLFQVAGLLHPRIRSALLPRELLGKRNRCIKTRIGSPIPPSEFPSEDDTALAAYFREQTLMLGS